MPKSTPTRAIREYFEDFGVVNSVSLDSRESKRIGVHKISSHHRGSGIVEFSDIWTARSVAGLHSHYLEGVEFEVRMAISRKAKKKRDREEILYQRKVYITGIQRNLSKNELISELSRFGNVISLVLIRKDSNGNSGAFAVFD